MSLILVAGLNIIEVDAAITETYTTATQYTRFPVEDGYEITDHFIETPERIVIDGLHTNYPAIIGASLRVSPVRAEQLDEEFKDYQKDGQLLDVLASLRWLTDMVITDYQSTRDATNASALRFTMTLQKFESVTSQVVGDVPIPKIPKAYPPLWVGLKAARTATAAATAAIGITLIALGEAS